MLNIEKLSNDSNLIIIGPDKLKISLLESFSRKSELFNGTFLTLPELKKRALFDYNAESVKYLVNKGFSISNSYEILDNILYIVDRNYGVNKLDHLVSLKKELDEKGLLIHDPLFKEFIKNKKVLVLGYGKLDKFSLSILPEKTEVIEYELHDRDYVLNEFDNNDQEVEFLYNSIFELINNSNIDINNIYVLNYSKEYESYFKRYNTYYDFKIEVKDNESLLGLEVTKRFISLLETSSKEDIFNYLNEINNDVSNKLISILNKYARYDLKEVKDLILYDLSNTKVSNDNLKDVVKCVDNFYEFNDNDYVFLIGFNDTYPRLKRDIDYITNNLRPLLNMSLIEEENSLIKENTKAYLSNIKNLTLSYSRVSPFVKHEFETLLDNVKLVKLLLSYEYSSSLNKAKYGYMLDRLTKYKFMDKDLDKMYLNYDENDYLSYDNSFNGLDKDQLKRDKKLKLSYSSLTSFYECKFKYFLSSVLYLRDNKANFFARFGSLAHEVLKEAFSSKTFNFDDSWSNNLIKLEKENNYKVFEDESEAFFGDKLKEEIRLDINIIKEQLAESTFNDVMCEKDITVNVNDDVVFNGKIDKILFKDFKDYIGVAIVDYKTGDTKVDESLMDLGLSLQLPCYMYLIRHLDEFKDAKFVGTYLQNIINSDLKNKNDLDLDLIKKESMKLNGLSSNSLSRLASFDTSLINNKKANNIKGIRLTNSDEFYANSKVYSDDEFDEFIKLANDKILEASKDILKGDFKINPIMVNGENKSCKYCEYRDICFRRNKDLRNINISKEENDG